MKKTRFSLQENFPGDGSIAAEINRKLNLGETNNPCFFCELKSQCYFTPFFTSLIFIGYLLLGISNWK
jgi:hypothetical protein